MTHLERCRILVVDDQESNMLLVTGLLRKAGFEETRGCSDARRAMAEVRDWAPDLVLLDLHMPHVDGISVLKTIRLEESLSEFLPVLVLTADTNRETLARAMEAGANDFLTKPFDTTEVVLRVRNLLAIRVSHETLKASNAGLAATLLRQLRVEEEADGEREARITAARLAIDRGASVTLEPILELATGRIMGFEATARFDWDLPPERWLAEAASLGLGVDLELAGLKAAVQHFELVRADEFMAVQVSPATLLESRAQEVLRSCRGDRIVVELTDRRGFDDVEDVVSACVQLRQNGMRVALVDAQSGSANLHRLLMLEPDIIKFDGSLTRDIDSDRVNRALVTSLLRFAQETDARIIAAGIETEAELATVRSLGIEWGQGLHVADFDLGGPSKPMYHIG
jgi:EAL domain-containing protein (putative c-di-GMP-specific phosphodiesterase class I)